VDGIAARRAEPASPINLAGRLDAIERDMDEIGASVRSIAEWKRGGEIGERVEELKGRVRNRMRSNEVNIRQALRRGALEIDLYEFEGMGPDEAAALYKLTVLGCCDDTGRMWKGAEIVRAADLGVRLELTGTLDAVARERALEEALDELGSGPLRGIAAEWVDLLRELPRDSADRRATSSSISCR
jgi:hypothetical protein